MTRNLSIYKKEKKRDKELNSGIRSREVRGGPRYPFILERGKSARNSGTGICFVYRVSVNPRGSSPRNLLAILNLRALNWSTFDGMKCLQIQYLDHISSSDYFAAFTSKLQTAGRA